MSVTETSHAGGSHGAGGVEELRAGPADEFLMAVVPPKEAVHAAGPSISSSEERFQLLLNAVTDYAIYMLDPEGRVMTWNVGAERSKGYKAEEVLGRSFSIFFLPEDAAAGLPELELEAAARDGRYAVDAWRRRKNGERFWAQVTLTAMRSADGELRGFAKVTRDMTAQLRAEEAIRDRNLRLEQYRIIVENVSEYVIFSMDPQGLITSWDGAAEKESGFLREQMLGEPFSIFFPADEVLAGVPEQELAEAARAGKYAVDAWRLTPGGRRLWSSSVLSAVRDAEGNLTGFVRVARPMTRQKEAEDALRQLNAQLDRYRIIVENVDEYSIYTLDAEGCITSWEAGAQRLSGTPAEQMLGRHYSTFFTPEEIAAGAPAYELAEAERTGRYASDSWRTTPKGQRVWSSGVLSALRDENGKLNGFMRIAHMLTAQKQAEESLARLAADLEKRVAERTRQLEATVSELRSKNDEVEALARVTARDLEEKRLMLNEIHHRVKNNLQVVQSLLKMSVRSLPVGEARSVTMTTAQRVFAMAMVHEHLYQTKDLAGISVSKYLHDLFAGVADSNVALHGQVRIAFDCDDLLLNLDHAIPFGLLVNELLANCLKHGYPDGRKGTVTVSVHRVQDAVNLVFQDDGLGLPEGFDAATCTSMGLKLAASLSHQLGGKLNFTSNNGCRVEARLTRL